MASYRSGNPALNKNTFKAIEATRGEAMTLEGVAGKSLGLLALCLAAGYAGWQLVVQSDSTAPVILIGSSLVAFLVAVILIFKKPWAATLAPTYAILEGLAVGGVSQYYEAAFQGIVLQSVLLTASIFTCMLLIYRFRIIRATENFKLGVASATAGIALYYLIDLGLGLFGRQAPLIASNSVYGLAFTAAVIVIAAFNLVIDFDFIESSVNNKLPKYMEWYASFGLLVTLVWLYLEILRFLGKIRSR